MHHAPVKMILLAPLRIKHRNLCIKYSKFMDSMLKKQIKL